ncbi:MAG TPA: prolyl oligopeptidase family serine peptidase, partial [Roseimicrobium sp.]|nr:prolyl oligopeptidase family serine peptidase [Roseimicrobium sp.]
HAATDSPEAKLIGGAILENKEKAAKANPIEYITATDPAYLIVHGDKDPTVAPNQSQLLYDALRKAGISVRYHTIHGAGHGGPGFSGKDVEQMVETFFDAQLKSKTPPSNRGEAATSESNAPEGSSAPVTPRNIPTAPGVANRPTLTWDQVAAREGVDKDGGSVPRAKFKGPPAIFDRLDRNKDGVLTKDDFAEAPQKPTP